MSGKIKTKKSEKKNTNVVRVNPVILDKVRQRKEKTGQEIGRFYDIAAEEKLEKDEKNEKLLKLRTVL